MIAFGCDTPPLAHARDPYATLRSLAEQGACHRLADGRQWLVVDPAAVAALLHHDALALPPQASLTDRSAAYREQVVPWLRRFMSTTHVDLLQQLTGQLMDERLADLAGQGKADLLTDFAGHVPVALMCTLLGCPPSDFPIVRRLATAIQGHYDLPSARGTDDIPSAETFLRQLVARRLATTTATRTTPLLAGLRTLWAEHPTLTHDSLVDTCTKLLTAGTSTLTGALGNVLDDLLDTPEGFSPTALREAVASPSARMRACELAVCVHTPVLVLKRDVQHAFEWQGHCFEVGQRLLMAVPSVVTGPRRLGPALTDAPLSHVDTPDETATPRKTVAFGHGAHYCLGAPLARLQIAHLLQRAPQLLTQWRRTGETVWRQAWLLHEPLHLPVSFTGTSPCN